MTTPEINSTEGAKQPPLKPVQAAPSPPPPAASSSLAPISKAPHSGKKTPFWLAIAALIGVGAFAAWPRIQSAFNTVSTDDAYVNGHVTFVAPRVAGQVALVLVEDNTPVRKGDLLLQLDKEPYRVQVDIAQAAVGTAKAELAAANAQTRGIVGHMRSARFNLEHSMQDVNNQISGLRSKVATMESKQATVTKAQADFDRASSLVKSGVVSRQEFDVSTERLTVAKAEFEEAQQQVYQVRAGLGLPPVPAKGDDLAKVPADLDQTFSSVREAQARLIEAASQIGVVDTFDKSPRQMVDDFYKRDPEGNIDRIYEKLIVEAPGIRQAEAKVVQAERNVEEALLNLRYCDIKAEIDGVVTRREVNPGNNLIAGESVMALRSVTDIWVDANFKETQLAQLRIGQSVDLDVDMYGGRQHFDGRISGFTIGTGSTLALLPAQNATGNFVKVVQRLPVRIDLLHYDPENFPLFIGLSVTPRVDVKTPPAGPGAGKILRPYDAAAQAANAANATTATATIVTEERP